MTVSTNDLRNGMTLDLPEGLVTGRRAVVRPALALLLSLAGVCAAGAAGGPRRYLHKPDDWFAGDEARRVAANVLSYQSDLGGWPKNVDTTAAPFRGDRKELKPTFDNGATTDELRFLAVAPGNEDVIERMVNANAKALVAFARQLPEEKRPADWIWLVPFSNQQVTELGDVRFTVPLLLGAAALWFAYRIVNFPAFADFLIATEAEINKVSWTTPKRLKQDTIVVLITVILLTLFLFVVDLAWSFVLSSRPIGVLQTPEAQMRKEFDDLLRRYDTNTDGYLSAEELATTATPIP